MDAHFTYAAYFSLPSHNLRIHDKRKQERAQNNMVTCEHTDQAVWLIEKCVTRLPQPGPPSLSDQLVVHSSLIHSSCFSLCHFCNLEPINSSHSTPLFIFATMASHKICVQNCFYSWINRQFVSKWIYFGELCFHYLLGCDWSTVRIFHVIQFGLIKTDNSYVF